MNKYYATITVKVLIQADDNAEARDILDSLANSAVEAIEESSSDVLDCGAKITDVK